MSFGWSVGDIIAALEWLYKIGSALQEAGGAKAEFQETALVLTGLESTLEFVKQQQQNPLPPLSSNSHLSPSQLSTYDAILTTQVDLIKTAVTKFLDEIEKYDKHLGTSSKRGFFHSPHIKVKWAVCVADEVTSLHASVAAPLRVIALLQQQFTM